MFKGPELLRKYKHLRNKVVHMVKRGKRDYLDKLKSASCKDFWKAVKNLNGRQSSIPTLNHYGDTATSDSEKATMLNNFFSSCFNQSIPPITPRAVKFIVCQRVRSHTACVEMTSMKAE